METIELYKENLQPLKSGRKVDALKALINQDSEEAKKREETRQLFEEKLKNSSDEELLDVYYDYIVWIEQNYPQGGKEANLKNIFEACIQTFYNQDKFKNNEKLLTIFLKFTDTLRDPLDLFKVCYKAGFGKHMAKFYISWSSYFEIQQNYKRALDAIEAGIKKNAQPIALLNDALNSLQVRTMRHVISSENKNSNDGDSRKALTSLKVKVDRHGKTSVPVHRAATSAAAPITGGLKNVAPKSDTDNKNGSNKNEQPFHVLCDDDNDESSPVKSTPVEILPIKNEENERKPGKWSENKLHCKSIRDQAVSGFQVYVDDEKVDNNDNNLCSNENNNNKQSAEPVESSLISVKVKEAIVPNFAVAKFEDKQMLQKYVWYSQIDQIYKDDTEYCFEELRYQKWLEKRQQQQLQLQQQHDSTKEESSYDEKSGKSSNDSTSYKQSSISIARGFYNGTLANTTVFTENLPLELYSQSCVKNEKPNNDDNKDNEPFVVYKDEPSVYQSNEAEHNNPPAINPSCSPTTTTVAENVTKPFEFTITTMKKDNFISCSSSTPFVGRTFKQPPNQKIMVNHPNFVTGITAKLSPINEVSRESNSKSSSSSSGTMSCTTGYTTGYTNGHITKHTTRKSIQFPEKINPFESDLKSRLLHSCAEPVKFRKGFNFQRKSQPVVSLRNYFTIDQQTYISIQMLSDSNFGKVYLASLYKSADQLMGDFGAQFYAFKLSDQLNYWDFYIRDELTRRQAQKANSTNIVPSILMNDTTFFANGSCSKNDSPQLCIANLRTIIDHFHNHGKSFPSILLNYFVLELIDIIKEYHQCNIIHADISPENLFVCDYDLNDVKSKKTSRVMKLADFSNSIDMQLLPVGTVFGENFTGKQTHEILNHKSWTYSIDWIDLLDCIHQMLFGTSMQLINIKQKWQCKQSLPNKFWTSFFEKLLNMEVNQKSPTNLEQYQEQLRSNLSRRFSLLDLFSELSMLKCHLTLT